MATFQMPKVSRGARLQPAAPLKKLSDNTNNNNNHHTIQDKTSGSADSPIVIFEDEDSSSAERKENVVARNCTSGASRRTLKLEKPRPLKSARPEQKITSICEKNQSEPLIPAESKAPKRLSDIERSKKLSPESAKLTSEKLIQQSLHDLNSMAGPQCNDAPPQEMNNRTRLLSQVSEDSGYGEMSAYSRQGRPIPTAVSLRKQRSHGMLESLVEMESLEESQNDSIWNADDEIYTAEDRETMLKKRPLEKGSTTNCDNPSAKSHTTYKPDSNHISANSQSNVSTTYWARWETALVDFQNKQGDMKNLGTKNLVAKKLETETCRMSKVMHDNNGYIPPVDMTIPGFASKGKPCYPEDIDLIEMELESLRDELGDCDEGMDSSPEDLDEVEAVRSVSGIQKGGKKTSFNGWVIKLREPISPVTMLADIYKIESEMPGGVYSAKGRRRMFRSLEMCRQDGELDETICIFHYTPEELLEIGSSSICQLPPESWAYRCEIMPEVCLPKAAKYFDPKSYIDERSYVEANVNYVSTMEQNSRSAASTENAYSRNTEMASGSSQQKRNPWKPSNQSFANRAQQQSVWNQSSDPKRFSNQSTTRTFQTGSLPDIDEVDLNTKCDVRVRKFPTAQRNGVVPGLNVRTVAENTFEPRWMRNDYQEPSWNNDKVDERGDLYVNQNLPGKCPW